MELHRQMLSMGDGTGSKSRGAGWTASKYKYKNQIHQQSSARAMWDHTVIISLLSSSPSIQRQSTRPAVQE